MARLDQEAIETFASITGVPEAVAIQKLEEHGGNLNEAVNAHFSEGDRNTVNATSLAPQDDVMDIDEPIQVERPEPPFPLLSAGRGRFNPYSLPNESLTRRLFDAGSDLGLHTPFVTHPRNIREIPIEVKDGNGSSAHSGRGPTIEDVTGTERDHGPEVRGNAIIEVDDVPAESTARATRENEDTEDSTGVSSRNRNVGPSPTGFHTLPDSNDEIEEEMIQAAIEASKQDIERSDLLQNESSEPGPPQRQSQLEDPELAHAVSLSLKTTEQEKALDEQIDDLGDSKAVDHNSSEVELSKLASSNGRLDTGGPSNQDEVEEVEQPLIRQRPRRSSARAVAAVQEIDDDPPPSEQNIHSQHQHDGSAFPSDVWGGISSEEHDEAVMLEAAMFGGIPEGTGYSYAYGPHQFMRGDSLYPRRPPRPPSPSLEAQRLIREQQDDEYLASLQADQEKEMRAKADAEARRLEEEAAREAALEEERQKEEESRRKLEEEQEFERQLAAKEASLPQEPMPDDENAITLLVRMPDGSRRGRRFLKSDKLQCLFDFIDIGRVVKPGTYRLVRPYPRRAFTDGESMLTLKELGLTSKQEALFLEVI
ncbi:plant UBX domain-containing protein 8-like [Rhodamnia argentea]|uniref:Plant UBX domain-containing protein 8-like n=1 Tax=Rhodamnia argentea TaxID=178133 RepID=A0ABM3H6L7_9MYRT|nr:plant UBX domain-containing protein 8-like [Rhodamnia argentea]